ncbi:MAG: acetoacetate decarboxylase family protein [bacterium]|nr:acetoacetate decarboxylase family protein [bacterium]
MKNINTSENSGFPPPPWEVAGKIWIGFFKTAEPLELPDPLKPAFVSQRVIIALVRYLEGPLIYDELVFSSPARFGKKIAAFVHNIWVDDEQSVMAGRTVWGVPKEMAEFKWQENTVSVNDSNGHIITMTLTEPTRTLPRFKTRAPGFGRIGSDWVLSQPIYRWRLGPGKMHIQSFAERFPFRIKNKQARAITAPDFFGTMNVPRIIKR